MFDSFLFFTYIFAGLVGFLAIMLIVILAKHWSSGNKNLLSSMRNFMICTALIDSIYFCIDYHALKTGMHATMPVFRVLDIWTFIGQVYFFSAYMREKSQFSQSTRKKLEFVSIVISFACMIVSLISYGFFMDDYYFVHSGTLRILSILIELLLCALLTVITILHLIKALNEIVQKQVRISITIISLLMTANGVWNGILVISLMTDMLSAEEELLFDPTALMIFAINLFTVLLVYREDFTALFHVEAQILPQENQQNDKNYRLDFIAETHSLTEREREVMELAYEGLTNPEIADELFISKYTVKRHMHNIFEKLDISTRMELVHLINKENGPSGPLK